MKRADLVTVALPGSYGKPRPALVVQSDLFAEHPSVTIVPVTSELRETPLFRIDLAPDARNNLEKPSQAMVDKMQTVPREKLGPPFGSLDEQAMLAVTRSMAVFLGIA